MMHILNDGISLTCYIQMGIACGLAQLVGNNTLVDTSMGMADRADNKTVYISDYR